jgi:hypothetical protein
MARIKGADRGPSVFAKAVFWFAKRRLGTVPVPVRIHALHSRIFGGYARMELAQDRAKQLPAVLKGLVGIRAATLIGCPF